MNTYAKIKKNLIILPALAMLLFGSKNADLKEKIQPLEKPLVIEENLNYQKEITKFPEKAEISLTNQTDYTIINDDANKIFQSKQFINEPEYEKELKNKIEFNYKKEGLLKKIDYVKYNSFFNKFNCLYSNYPDKKGLEDIMINIKDNKIDSYNNLIQIAKNLPEIQKILLGNIIVNSIYGYNYDSDLNNKQLSQEDFFNRFRYSLITGKENGIGGCRHISNFNEKFLEDIGIQTDSVDNPYHTYNISKTSNGIVISDQDYGKKGFVFLTNSKNVKKTLELCDKEMEKTIAFKHYFYDKNKFKYEFETEDGKHFFDFIGYDNSTKPVKESLEYERDNENNLEMIIDHSNFVNSAYLSYQGFFIKGGEIKGSQFSPMDKTDMGQIGFRKNVFVSNFLKLKTDISFTYGRVYSSEKKINLITYFNTLKGGNIGLILATNKKEGLNLSGGINGGIYIPKIDPEGDPIILAGDLKIDEGVSYNIKMKKIKIKPYFLTQERIFKKESDIQNFGLKISEISGGAILSYKILNDINFSIDPHYTKRIWEQEFGLNTKIENRNFALTFGGYKTKSNYSFCPDKEGYLAGGEINLRNIEVGVDFKREIENYDREKEKKDSINFRAGLKF